MVAAFPLIAIIFAVQAHGEAAVVALAMTVIGFVCYAERRYKSTEWAYRYVITLDRLSARGADAAQIEGARIRRHFRPK
jgi:peptidoglycan/LPS O-acetylase OafA/YrhL